MSMHPTDPKKILELNEFAEKYGHSCVDWGAHDVDDRFRDHVIVPGMIEAHAHTLEGAFSMLPYVGWFDRHRVDGGISPGLRSYDGLLDRLRELDAATAGSPPRSPSCWWPPPCRRPHWREAETPTITATIRATGTVISPCGEVTRAQSPSSNPCSSQIFCGT